VLASPGLDAKVRRQIWQRMTGRRVTVTGKRRVLGLLIASDHARCKAHAHNGRRPHIGTPHA